MRLYCLLAGVVVAAQCCHSQTTQGIIAGLVRDLSSNAPLGGATVEYEQLQLNTRGTAHSAKDGNFYLPLLPPGSYRIRVSFKGYQAREIYGVDLTVAGYTQINFDLRPLSDVWERGLYGSAVFRGGTVVPFYGPDIDPSYVGTFEPERLSLGQLEPSVSAVIDPQAIATLPLAGRDIYSALSLLPGVTTDSTSNRSLGLSANGQRPTSSNFLQDGVEENNSLIGGPLISLPPEMIQEYRVSTNNFSAEYGRTAGYLANAVSRSAGEQWHGILYGDLGNDRLNANTFQHNSNNQQRTTAHQIEAGFSAGGRLPKTRVRIWTGFDEFGSRSYSDSTSYLLPTEAFAKGLKPGTRATALLAQYPPIEWAPPSVDGYGSVNLSAPVTLRRKTALERIDYAISKRHSLMARASGEILRRPDFNWSPYGQAPLTEQTFGFAGAVTSVWTPSLVSELRGGVHKDSLGWDIVLPGLPQIDGIGNLMLPGNYSGVNRPDLAWRDRTLTAEISGTLTKTTGAHVFRLGAGELETRPETRFEIPPITDFTFNGDLDQAVSQFAAGQPSAFDLVLSSTALRSGMAISPDTIRSYRYDQQFAFMQDDWRLSSRLTLNAGFRYDRFPAPENIGAQPDTLIAPGTGSTLTDQIANAVPVSHTGELFSNQPDNFAVRLGFSVLLLRSRGTVIRGGFGVFHDRPPDNFWISASANDMTPRNVGSDCAIPSYASGDYRHPNLGCTPQVGDIELLDLTLFHPNLRAPVVQSIFLSLQQPLGRNLALELSFSGSRGRHLLTTDLLNRGFPNSDLSIIGFRTNQGFSDYTAGSAKIRYRRNRTTFSAASTWSRSIDNQSDPLLGEYFDLGFSNPTDRTNQRYYGSFTLQGDTRADRGNSDFDQRVNLIGWASYDIPAPRTGWFVAALRNWSAAGIFTARSGLPYSVFAGVVSCAPVCNTRANLINPAAVSRGRKPIAGGVQLLNAAAFEPPLYGENGNTGRNAFDGPGFANLDVSLSRKFAVKPLGEQARVILRADAFNVLNHANLQNPASYLGRTGSIQSRFGTALFGRTASNSGFPALTPEIENPRLVQFLLRFEF